MRLKRRRAEVLGHDMILDPLDALDLSLNGIHEPFCTRILTLLARPGDTIVDVGANIGYFTLIFARAVGAGGKVYAFEPEPVNYAVMAENVSRNGYENVIPLQLAVSDVQGVARLAVFERNRGMNRLWQETTQQPTVEIEMVVIDQLERLSRMSVDLIKMDVEGWENHALSGMRNLLERSPDVAIFSEFTPEYLVKAGSDPEEFLTHLCGSARRLYWFDEANEVLRPFPRNDWRLHPKISSQVNLLALGGGRETHELPLEAI
jgi:FkbM family methyltransferase